MQITVSGKQIDLSDALRTHVSEQLNSITRKYFDHALEALITFGRARSFFTCDINLHAGRGLLLRAEGEAQDAHAAFEDAAEHIAKRLRRYRRRLNEHARDLANRARPETARQYVLSPEAEAPVVDRGAETGPFPAVIAEMATEISRLSVGDAVMRLDLTDQQVLMFRSETTGELNVVYRRPDGNIGWIEPGKLGKAASCPPDPGESAPPTSNPKPRARSAVPHGRAR